MYCIKCGAELRDGSRFCTSCGATIELTVGALGAREDAPPAEPALCQVPPQQQAQETVSAAYPPPRKKDTRGRVLAAVVGVAVALVVAGVGTGIYLYLGSMPADRESIDTMDRTTALGQDDESGASDSSSAADSDSSSSDAADSSASDAGIAASTGETDTDAAATSDTQPFWGAWTYASKDQSEAEAQASQLTSQGYTASVVTTSDWENLNSETWYAVTVGKWSTEAEAQTAVDGLVATGTYTDAYAKYTGSYIG